MGACESPQKGVCQGIFDRARERGEDTLGFDRNELSKRLDIHACRAEYTRKMYVVYEAQGCGNSRLYRCRNERRGEVYDKEFSCV